MPLSNTSLVSGAAHLLNNGEFSDLKIKCEDQQISAHKLVVCTPSTVLHAMCTAGFQESQSNTIDLSHDTKRVVYRMVEFLYRGDYQDLDHPDYQLIDKNGPDRSGAHHAVLHADMFAVADKYDIAALGDAAKTKFEEASNVVGLDNGNYLDVFRYVYSTTPESNRGLRDVVVGQIRTRGCRIMADAALNSRLEEIVSTTPQLAWDVFRTSLSATSFQKPSLFENSDIKTENPGGGLFGSGISRIVPRPTIMGSCKADNCRYVARQLTS